VRFLRIQLFRAIFSEHELIKRKPIYRSLRSVDEKIIEVRTRHFAIKVRMKYIFSVMAVQFAKELVRLISILLFRNFEDLISGEHKLLVSFTKFNIVNLFLTLHVLIVLCMTDDYFIQSRISMLGYCVSKDSLDEWNTGVVCR